MDTDIIQIHIKVIPLPYGLRTVEASYHSSSICSLLKNEGEICQRYNRPHKSHVLSPICTGLATSVIYTVSLTLSLDVTSQCSLYPTITLGVEKKNSLCTQVHVKNSQIHKRHRGLVTLTFDFRLQSSSAVYFIDAVFTAILGKGVSHNHQEMWVILHRIP